MSARTPVRSRILAVRAISAGLAVCLPLAVAVGLHLAQRPSASAQTKAQADPNLDPLAPFPFPPELVGVDLLGQSDADKDRKSVGCVECHQNVRDPHFKDTLRIGCCDCHGGNPAPFPPHEVQAAIAGRKNGGSRRCPAGPSPQNPESWRGSANPVRSYALLNHEAPDFIRFVNPGDLRVNHISCGTSGCHVKEVDTNRKQIMTTGAMLWGAALYNNGTVPFKRARYGELYSMTGVPLRLQTQPHPSQWEMEKKGVVPYLDPLPRFEASQPGNVLRIFEMGGRFRPEVGIPERDDDPGKPRTRLSLRGLGTENRTDPVFVSLSKTRLFDPTLNFLGTNDHPGDYRSSGCSSCHVIYANDRSAVNSGPYAKHGHLGTCAADNPDPTIPKNEAGHPISHRFTNAIPSSQCMTCHVHPGTTVMNSYLGYMWWDEETEGRFMYPKKQKKIGAEEFVKNQMLNPDEAAGRGLWIERDFLNNVTDLNEKMDKTQFGDFHSHGWVFRAVFRNDKEGNLLSRDGHVLPPPTAAALKAAVDAPLAAREAYKKKETLEALRAAEKAFEEKYKHVPVHYLDIHLEKGMHCVDCHFVQDMHGNGRLHMEVRAACEIQCIDCHGTASEYTTLRTSGVASYTSTAPANKDDPKLQGRDLAALKTPYGKRRLEKIETREGKVTVYQNSMVEENLRWEAVQTKDTVTKGHYRYNPKSDIAKTVRVEEGKMVWGDLLPGEEKKCAHQNNNMHCIACHSSWNPSCYGCHLPQKANMKMPMLHWDGDVTRNYVHYNFQTLRADVYMLARDGDATGNRIGPARSSCAIHVGSYNGNRESIYVQQQTISGEGLSGIAFSTNVPHTVRGKDGTKQCTDCHISKANDNNAWMAQLMMQGTNYLNFIGRYSWMACGEEGLRAVEVTERGEPQAVFGSKMHELAFPDDFKKHVEHDRKLEHAHEHPGYDISKGVLKPFKKSEVLSVQTRGEYMYAACGEDGVRVFDIAFIDDKAFAERITTAPFSPFGQRFYVKTKNARYVNAPTTLAPDPTRTHRPENKEPTVPLVYAFIYVADAEEGLILIQVATTIDGNPKNNFLKRAATFNPDGKLKGARYVTFAGNYCYVCCERGVVVVDVSDSTCLKIVGEVEEPFIKGAKMLQIQFRYAYVVDEEGIKVLDVTDLKEPKPVALMRLEDCHSIYLARTYAYVAAGKRGLAILDIKTADRPRLDQIYDAGGAINDLRDVKLGITYTSEFAYLADGKNGMRIVQLTSPETPGNEGYIVRPTPCLIATYPLKSGKALMISKGVDRDRAVDESGTQIAVFGRVGARPFNKKESEKLYLRDERVWRVSDNPYDVDLYEQRRYMKIEK